MGKHGLLAALVLSVAAGCSGTAVPARTAKVDPIAAAVTHAQRSDTDRARDTSRRPREVLAFFGIDPGMTVLDMFSGGGYYTEILSRVVGHDGRVVAQNNAAYVAFAKDEIAARYAGDRLGNVQRVMAENNELDLPRATFDAALLILAYHDIYYVDTENDWPRIDGPKMLAEIYQAMKPGAVLGVVDHVAADGAPADAGSTLHRIDPARLRRELTSAGFVFEQALDVLRNPDDQLDKPMFDPAVRGKTDRVVYRFRRPG